VRFNIAADKDRQYSPKLTLYRTAHYCRLYMENSAPLYIDKDITQPVAP
jgi:hypothetical protein